MTGSLSFQAAKFANTGETPPPVGNHHPLTAPMGVYRASDGYFNLAAGNDRMFTRLAEAIAQPDLVADPRFAGGFARVQNRRDLDAILDEVFVQRQTAEWVELLTQPALPAVPFTSSIRSSPIRRFSLPDCCHDVTNEAWGPHNVIGLPLKLSRTPPVVDHAAPMNGEHRVKLSKAWDIRQVD